VIRARSDVLDPFVTAKGGSGLAMLDSRCSSSSGPPQAGHRGANERDHEDQRAALRDVIGTEDMNVTALPANFSLLIPG
jgi:hypothetical protein